jgi:hypothetical protein
MLIALDYDKTYTADTVLWDGFVKMAQDCGHVVKIVTMRTPKEAITGAPVEVVYTSRKAKATVVAADIWIDDSPQWVYQDSL